MAQNHASHSESGLADLELPSPTLRLDASDHGVCWEEPCFKQGSSCLEPLVARAQSPTHAAEQARLAEVPTVPMLH